MRLTYQLLNQAYRSLRLICAVFGTVFSLGISQPSFALPRLNELVVNSDIDGLTNALKERFSEEDLGNALIAAAGVNNTEAIRLLIGAGAKLQFITLGQSPLIIAVSEGNTEAVELLLQLGADPNEKGLFNWTPLHFAAKAKRNDGEIVKFLLQGGAQVDARSTIGVTPLHRASGFCKVAAVEQLIKGGANPSLVDGQGQTAKQRAARVGCSAVENMLP